MTARVVTSYLSHRLDLPPLVAQAAYDAHLAPIAAGVCVQTQYRARLAVRRHRNAWDGTGYGPYRTSDALLIAGLHTWRVQLELLPWSADDTELGLRAMRRRLGATAPSHVYVRSGLAVLDELSAQIRRWVDEPLRATVNDHVTDVGLQQV